MNTIRPATRYDLDGVVTIVRNATQSMEEHGIAQWDQIYPSDSILQGDIENRYMYVIEKEGSVAGLIVLNEEESPEYSEVYWTYPGRALVIHRLTIDPEHQRKKLASQLMDFAEREAALRGYDTIRLDAFTQNPAAVVFYERRGYRKAGVVHFRKGPFFCYEKPVVKSKNVPEQSDSFNVRQEGTMKAIGFDLGDTLVEYEGVPLNWEMHYPGALSNLAEFVGNERKDIEAARRFGCFSILVDRAGHRKDWGQDLTISSLADLPQVLSSY